MRAKWISVWISVIAGVTFAMIGCAASRAETAALSGRVTSSEEGPMEGVLVSAKLGTIAVTVVSDSQGRWVAAATTMTRGHANHAVATPQRAR